MILTKGKTLQQVSDEIAAILAVQGRCVEESIRTISDNGTCVYGNNEGKHCGIGLLLDPNDEELMNFRGSVDVLTDMFDDGRLGVNDQFIRENIKSLMVIQTFHDSGILYAEAAELAGLDITAWQEFFDAK